MITAEVEAWGEEIKGSGSELAQGAGATRGLVEPGEEYEEA